MHSRFGLMMYMIMKHGLTGSLEALLQTKEKWLSSTEMRQEISAMDLIENSLRVLRR